MCVQFHGEISKSLEIRICYFYNMGDTIFLNATLQLILNYIMAVSGYGHDFCNARTRVQVILFSVSLSISPRSLNTLRTKTFLWKRKRMKIIIVNHLRRVYFNSSLLILYFFTSPDLSTIIKQKTNYRTQLGFNQITKIMDARNTKV